MTSSTLWLKHLRHFVSVGLLLFLATLLSLFIAELMVRVIAPQQLISYRPDIYGPAAPFGHRHVANARTTVNTGERTVRLMTDHEGFRIGRRGRIDADTRILFLGDSFLQAIQVEHEHSFAGILESRLPQRLGRRLAIRNTGVAGWDPNRYLLQARYSLPREAFDLLIVLITVENDVIAERHEVYPPVRASLIKPFRIPRNLSRAELVNAVLYPLNDFLEARSHLFILARRQAHTLRMRLGLSPLNLPRFYYRSAAAMPAWDTTAAVLADVGRLSTAHGAPAFFVLLPSDYQVDSVSFNHYVRGFGIDPAEIDLEQPNRRLAESMRARGLHVIDALPVLRAAYAEGTRAYGTIDPHLNHKGHQLIAGLLEPVILTYLSDSVRVHAEARASQ